MQQIATNQFVPRRFPVSVKMYHVMAENGVFAPDDRIELIGGEIYNMSPIGSLHARCVDFLTNFLVRAVGTGYIVRVQNPIILDDASEPQPDITVLGYKNDFYKDALPTARDVAMIVEVSDTSSEFDRIVKLPRYASSGIPEFWLIDLVKDHVEVHTNPTEDTYGSTSIYQRGERAVSETIPAIDLLVDEILG